jgi:hypothetical protein
VAEVAHHLLDGVLHAVELGEGGIALDDLVGEQARQALVVARVDQLGLSDRLEHALRGSGVGEGLTLADVQVLLQRELLFSGALVARGETADHVHLQLLRWRVALAGRRLRRERRHELFLR